MNIEALLAHFPKLTPKRFAQAMTAFGSPDTFFHSNAQALREQLKWKADLVSEFLSWRQALDPARIEKILIQEQIQVLTQDSPEYPDLLKEIHDPPFCLFVRGTLTSDQTYPIAIVGTRKCSAYGKQVTQEIVSELAGHGISIISGLALGIDGIAHQAALDARGHTIAVLGSGNNTRHIYPATHKDLAEKIIHSGGAVISEYPPGSIPSRFTFPRRNRIISGMSLGTLVIEAPEKSGALITTSCAIEHNREVFAIPHPITSHTGTGPNKLIKEGAHMITGAKDIIEILHLDDLNTFSQNAEIIPDSPAEASLLAHLSREAIHVDELTKQSGLTSSEVNSTLTIMEMKGKVRNLGNMQYVIAR